MELFGRRAETAALDRLLDRAADGAGGGLVMWGEPGIGKTALLEHAVEAAPTPSCCDAGAAGWKRGSRSRRCTSCCGR